MLLTCQAGYESLLGRELAELHGLPVAERGPGWVRIGPGPAGAPAGRVPDPAFAHLTLLQPCEVRGDAVNALAARVNDFFLESLRGERIAGEWPCVWLGPPEPVGLGRRISSVESAAAALLGRKLARVARLARPDPPRPAGGGVVRGLFVFFADFGRLYVAREAVVHGPRRMADDDQAPSRSYLKVEEAYGLIGREPQPGETVCDLGAAPGGWSYSAAKRGATVIAVDNGPLKGGALGHPRIEHRREDAFRFGPPAGGPCDWLFCDMVEEPQQVLQRIVVPWLERGWCRRLVVNLKFGRVDPIALLRGLRAADSPFTRFAPGSVCRHLYHDREELTVAGECTRP